jgi:hypothetical protein
VVGEPVVDAGEDRDGAILPDRQSGGRVATADLGLDGVEIADEGHAFLGNRRGSGAGDLDQLAAGMREDAERHRHRDGNRRAPPAHPDCEGGHESDQRAGRDRVRERHVDEVDIGDRAQILAEDRALDTEEVETYPEVFHRLGREDQPEQGCLRELPLQDQGSGGMVDGLHE